MLCWILFSVSLTPHNSDDHSAAVLVCLGRKTTINLSKHRGIKYHGDPGIVTSFDENCNLGGEFLIIHAGSFSS